MPDHVLVPKRAQREIDSLPATVRNRVVQAIDYLAHDPRPSGCTKLTGHRDEYRVRVGDDRVRYEIRDTDRNVMVLRVRHRRDVSGDVYRP